jgi:hypothetical protein
MPKPYGLRPATDPRPLQTPIDTSTTDGVVSAIESQRYKNSKDIPMSAALSLPVLVDRENQVLLSFFLYLNPGPFSNKKVLPPFSRVEVFVGQPEYSIKFSLVEPKDLNLNIPPMTELGCVQRDFSYLSDEEEREKRYQKFHLEIQRFYASVDVLLNVYPKPIETLSEKEKIEIKVYKDYFYAKEEVKFLLPAYQALNSHFFDWIDWIDSVD